MDEIANNIQMALIRVILSDEMHKLICDKIEQMMNEWGDDDERK